jgi:hypothetical protein
MKSPFLMTPEQHRARAAQLRKQGSEEAVRLAIQHDQVAMAIEKRLGMETASPPIAPA